MTPIRTESARQSDRVAFRMPIEVSWYGSGGVLVKQQAVTLLISRNGGVIRLTERLDQGQELTLKRTIEDGALSNTAHARVGAEIDREPDGFLYAIHLLEGRSDFWDVEFPMLRKADEAIARMMMECSFCQRREVVYLNELELKSFEVRKCVARHCPHCDSPSIWIESLSEVSTLDNNGARISVEERVVPRRNRTRVKARVLACVRRRGFAE